MRCTMSVDNMHLLARTGGKVRIWISRIRTTHPRTIGDHARSTLSLGLAQDRPQEEARELCAALRWVYLS